MSAFNTYLVILIILYIIYYAVAIFWELKFHKIEDEPFYEPEDAFGFKEVHVQETSIEDGTFSVSDNKNNYVQEYDESPELEEDPIFEDYETVEDDIDENSYLTEEQLAILHQQFTGTEDHDPEHGTAGDSTEFHFIMGSPKGMNAGDILKTFHR